MGIKCEVCDREFKSTITNSHLRKHNMTTAEYAELYGKDALSSMEYKNSRSKSMSGSNNPNFGNKWSDEKKESLSQKNKGKEPWNKGKVITSTESLNAIRDGVKKRETRYNSNELERPTYDRTAEIKDKISNGVKRHAAENPEEISTRAKKAYQTRIKNGGDASPMLGKQHSAETKERISTSSKEWWTERQKELRVERDNRLAEYGYTVVSEDSGRLIMECGKCGNDMKFHAQYSDPCRLTDKLCPTCNPRYVDKSLKQTEIYNYIKGFFPSAILSYPFDGRKEIDIFIPELNVGFEYSGLYWHSQKILEQNGQHKHKDVKKYKLAKEHGIRIYEIFEDEYLHQKNITMSRINNILGLTTRKIYARKCEVVEVSSTEANEFMEVNHLMGGARSNCRLGLKYEGELVSVMTFSKSNVSRKVHEWEINRFASILGINVIGGASRLFKRFQLKEMPKTVISYADTRWSDGNLYSALGFDKVSDGSPNYWYFYGSQAKRIHRYSLRKCKDDNQSLTEYENRLLQGYDRIYDYGSSKWIWNV